MGRGSPSSPGRDASRHRLGCALCPVPVPWAGPQRAQVCFDSLEVARHLRVTWRFLWVTVPGAGSVFPITEGLRSGGSAAVTCLPIFSSCSVEKQLTRILCKFTARNVMAGWPCVMPRVTPRYCRHVQCRTWSVVRGREIFSSGSVVFPTRLPCSGVSSVLRLPIHPPGPRPPASRSRSHAVSASGCLHVEPSRTVPVTLS